MSTQPAFNFDITYRKHGGNEESVAANPSVESKRESHREILKVLRVAGASGQTAKEIAAYFQKPLHKISGRLSELKEMGQIEPTGERRNGSAVLRVKA